MDLNRTRLECKVIHATGISHDLPIWIEPDWNVKKRKAIISGNIRRIWIEPDWNVKELLKDIDIDYYFIWIEPDWNVKDTATRKV